MINKTYVKNTAVLFAAMAITKIVGACFKIPLANILGGTGMGFFSAAYGLYSPVFALTAAGIPTVLMRLTAQNLAGGRCKNAMKVKSTAMRIFAAVGAVGTLLVMLSAKPFAQYIAASPESALAIQAISPAIMLCCIASVIRGYYEGQSNVMPSAAASVAEAVSRAVFGLAMSYGVILYANSCFSAGNRVFGQYAANAEHAYRLALPYAAAAAILAVSISELFGLVTLIIADRKIRCLGYDNKPTDSRRSIARQLLVEILPIAASALVMNCISFIDLLTVTRTITDSAAANPAFFQSEYAAVLPQCGGIEGLANFMYGSYTGIALSLFMIIPSFAGMTEKTSVPEIASAWEIRNDALIAEKSEMLFRAAALIGFPACLGAAALGEPILNLLYASRQAEISVALGSFTVMCLGGVFMVVGSSMFGVYQAIGKAYIPLILMIVSVAIKLMLNPLLMSVPEINITGAAIATSAGYVVMTLLGALLLKRSLPRQFSLIRATGYPFFCAVCCGTSAHIAYKLLSERIANEFSTLLSILIGGFIYILLLVINRHFYTFSIIKQQNDKKIKKPLAKYRKIG